MRALDLPGDDAIYELLLDNNRNIPWRDVGVFETEKGRALADAVGAVLSESVSVLK